MADKDKRLDSAMERRASKRFPIEQDVYYKVLDHRSATPESGSGKTLDMSSSGVLFGTEQRLRSGKRVELSVNWPAELDGRCALKFVVYGRVVRADDNQAAVHIEQYEFRTRRKDLPAADTAKPARAAVPYY